MLGGTARHTDDSAGGQCRQASAAFTSAEQLITGAQSGELTAAVQNAVEAFAGGRNCNLNGERRN